jgi:hypothetical protein
LCDDRIRIKLSGQQQLQHGQFSVVCVCAAGSLGSLISGPNPRASPHYKSVDDYTLDCVIVSIHPPCVLLLLLHTQTLLTHMAAAAAAAAAADEWRQTLWYQTILYNHPFTHEDMCCLFLKGGL